ncbi:DUF1778 domain-containing protein [Methylomicrobium agile]|uniref:type II toxin-antitoxin system TacA family antitoxin n=1 Tax=Methylomicrobium agile TaxID=39774 RepID=UPI0004DF3BCB|nr:DUF1778 domain-containing protein [Methylomicrobium agile]
MKSESNHQNILKVRMDAITLELLERARSYVDLDKSKFTRQCIREKAEAIIAEHESTHFGEEDWRVFFEMLDNPPEPTERMKKAASTYKKIIDNEEV